MVELHKSSTGVQTSDPKVKRAGSPLCSCVCVKRRQSSFEPIRSSSKEETYFSWAETQKSEPPEPSCASIKSDVSMGKPPLFSSGGEPSCISVKSDASMGKPPLFSSGGEPSCISVKSDASMGKPPLFSRGGEPSCISVKSDASMGKPPLFSSGALPSEPEAETQKSGSPEPSCACIKSDASMGKPPFFSSGGEPSCISVKSDASMGKPPLFSCGGEPSCASVKSDASMGKPLLFSCGGEPNCASVKSDASMGKPPLFSSGALPSEPELQTKSAVSSVSSGVSMKDHFMGQRPLFSSGPVPSDPEEQSTAALRALTLVEGTGHLHQDSDQPMNGILHRVLERHKICMKNKYESLFEGIKTQENKTLLNKIYIQLYIIEGESEGVNEEHEVLQMEKTSRKHLQDITLNCLDVFKPLRGPEGDTEQENKEEIEEYNITSVTAEGHKHKETKKDKGQKVQNLRTVLTKGIAGIGKTVSVQKFILDWAEGKANQDVDFMFVLPFRELNLIKNDEYSLHGLLCDFHPELKDLYPKIYDECKTVFVFDGLDESRIPLNFEQCDKVSDITMTSSVSVLMTNLIKGELLPSALCWITSRPAAANQIPPKYINRVTEIQGFNDPQKKEYFKKRISDEDQAKKIMSHIKKARSLHIMCHIPVFCWISATVLQRIVKQRHTEIPKTLTEMYSHFLITQTNMKNEKYEEKDERDPKNLLESNRAILLKLAELAFKQLMKGNVMFYEKDLRACGIDVTEASVYSGIFTEIFREECVLHQRKVYCFVHLSFQEFLAAVFVFHCCEIKNIKLLQSFKPQYREWTENVPLDELLKGAVDKAIESQNGHLDLFLRFLLGISQESNQRLLQGLLTHISSSTAKTTQYIKKLIKGDEDQQYHIPINKSLSTERSINLFLCLSEMNDHSLSREIQVYLRSHKHSEKKLSPGQCSALACMLLISEEALDELDLKKYNTSGEGYRRLVPAVTVCRKAMLAGCELTLDSCETICSTLQSVNCSLKELDLSKNSLQDSGVELLSAGLKSLHCKLETLRLALCNIGGKACENLRSILQSENSTLKELDLSNNDLQDSGVELLSAGLRSSHCKLEILGLSGCMVTENGCSSMASALKSNPSHLRELDLTYNDPGECGVKLLSDLQEDPHCTLEKIQLDHGGKIRMKPGLMKYACELTLDSNTANTHLFLRGPERKRGIKCVREKQSYPNHPERFDECTQVLSVESLTGHCYWEAEWSGREAVIAMTYKGIERKGSSNDCVFGYNELSWTLRCYCNSISDSYNGFNSYSVRHNKKNIAIPASPYSSHYSSDSNRVGVYLDWMGGTLSFYSVSPDTRTHIYTFYSTFTEPLYAGFRVGVGSSVCLCEME
ncbi:NACHT, LRR and PYD domains-containing protein 3-like [Colossoma macropomum]|uniref:NACHT, LRR and PYD domains-containing protein 3-like n=1 Tax=Colossoma macropomum TaxID=42526 RepID=UPI001863BA3E|nr:NACHT, LRR and PYD domains-containing protein 3-like [Colossoma macropomum]XP_036416697.1 NACHT, LRR and PYD domains-containing protein 3-like [Colossoma macropomum]